MRACSCAARSDSRTARTVWSSASFSISARSTTAAAAENLDRAAPLGALAALQQMALFPEDRPAPGVGLRCRADPARQTGTQRQRQPAGAPLARIAQWDRLGLDRFWGPRLPPSRKGTRWLDILKVQVCYHLIDPGSDWRLHRHWYEHSALRDLLGSDRVISDGRRGHTPTNFRPLRGCHLTPGAACDLASWPEILQFHWSGWSCGCSRRPRTQHVRSARWTTSSKKTGQLPPHLTKASNAPDQGFTLCGSIP